MNGGARHGPCVMDALQQQHVAWSRAVHAPAVAYDPSVCRVCTLGRTQKRRPVHGVIRQPLGSWPRVRRDEPQRQVVDVELAAAIVAQHAEVESYTRAARELGEVSGEHFDVALEQGSRRGGYGAECGSEGGIFPA